MSQKFVCPILNEKHQIVDTVYFDTLELATKYYESMRGKPYIADPGTNWKEIGTVYEPELVNVVETL